MTRIVSLLIAAVFALSGCTGPAPTTSPPASAESGSSATDLLERLDLAGRTAREVVTALDQDARARPLPFRASVRPDQVILSDGTGEATLPITGADGFYLAVAPFIEHTHECFNHSLATCQGELETTPVSVRITDSAGAVLVDTKTSTYANGFVSFWLPRDITGTVTVSAEGRTGSVPFATNADSPTCLTTLRLG